MGMFDSLYIELDGRETEVQTKRFDCALARYRLGDCVDGATPGVRVYFDELDLDAGGNLVYGRSDEAGRSLALFVVLAHGVFVEYSVSEGRLGPPAIQERIAQLRERWSDSARLLRISRTTLLQLCAQREHPSQVAQDRGGRISDIRSCTGATLPWAAVVRQRCPPIRPPVAHPPASGGTPPPAVAKTAPASGPPPPTAASVAGRRWQSPPALAPSGPPDAGQGVPAPAPPHPPAPLARTGPAAGPRSAPGSAA